MVVVTVNSQCGGNDWPLSVRRTHQVNCWATQADLFCNAESLDSGLHYVTGSSDEFLYYFEEVSYTHVSKFQQEFGTVSCSLYALFVQLKYIKRLTEGGVLCVFTYFILEITEEFLLYLILRSPN